MTRKLFALLLACLLILISFTACGTKTPEPGTTAAEDISAAETEANAQTSAEETSSEAVSESAEESTAQSAQKPTADKTVTYQPVVNIAIITCSPEHIGVASSQQLLGTNVGRVEDMGRKSGALIAINGEAGSTYKKGAPTIRNGSVVSTDGSGQKRLLIYRNGTWKVETLTNENCKSYISQGVYNSLRYQWQVIANGKATNEHDTYYHNRTVFAQISENKYIMAVGEFMPLDNMMKVLIAYGARNAFLLNGGNCSSMYVKGIGNTTGTKATQLKNLNKPCVIESEFFAANGMLGLNSAGKQKLGGPCNELDIVYVK